MILCFEEMWDHSFFVFWWVKNFQSHAPKNVFLLNDLGVKCQVTIYRFKLQHVFAVEALVKSRFLDHYDKPLNSEETHINHIL